MAFQGFVDEFTNSPVQPAFSTYLQLSITVDNPPEEGEQSSPIQLQWPGLDSSTTDPFSQVVNVISNDDTSNTIILPDATLASIQQTIIFCNQTLTAYDVVDFKNNAVTTVEAGQVWFVVLIDNTENDGINTWLPNVFGGTNTPANAAALVGSPGYGLLALNNLIVENNLIKYLGAGDTPYTIQPTDRGHYLIWNGSGTFVLNLPVTAAAPANFSNGFIFAFATGPTAGAVTVNPPAGQTLDGDTKVVTIQPDKSTWFVADGAVSPPGGWSTLGYEVTINSTLTPEDFPMNGVELNETPAQAAFAIQNFTDNTAGATLSTLVNLNETVSQQYFISNIATQDPEVLLTIGPNVSETFTLAQGEISHFYVEATSSVAPTSTKFFASPGSAINPVFQLMGNQTINGSGTGLYFTNIDFPAITQGGNEVVDFSYNTTTSTSIFNTPNDFQFNIDGGAVPSGSNFNFAYNGSDTNTITSSTNNFSIITKNSRTTNPIGFNITLSGSTFTSLSPVNVPSISLLSPSGNVALIAQGTSPLGIATVNGSTQVSITCPTFTVTASTNGEIITPLWTVNGAEHITGNLTVDGTINGQMFPITFPIPISQGGTGQVTQGAAFNALAPTTTTGDMITYSGGNNIRLGISSTQGKSLISNGTLPIWNGNSVLQCKAMPTYTGSAASWPPTNPVQTFSFTPTYANSLLLINISLQDSQGTGQSAGVGFQINGGSLIQIGNGRLNGGYGGAGSYCGIYQVTSTAAISFTFTVNNPYGGGNPTAWGVTGLNMTVTEIGGGPF